MPNNDSQQGSNKTPNEGTQDAEDYGSLVDKLKANASKLSPEKRSELTAFLTDQEDIRKEAMRTVRRATLESSASEKAQELADEKTKALESEVVDLRQKIAEIVSLTETQKLEAMTPEEREVHIAKTTAKLATADANRYRQAAESLAQKQMMQDILEFAAADVDDPDGGLGFGPDEIKELAKSKNSAEMQANMTKIQAKREKERKALDKKAGTGTSDEIAQLKAQLEGLAKQLKGGSEFIETIQSSAGGSDLSFNDLQNEYGKAVMSGDVAAMERLQTKYFAEMAKNRFST